ncbi:DUF1707 domain-containing protein [Pseudonocardia sp. NPDC049154]|uniref:DUF1707 SHOCT-like domain-containing protein n=1 Tax=Pseudonocardia sp. NPDC049154 TaxID=3155501 RepID=UPI0033F75A66
MGDDRPGIRVGDVERGEVEIRLRSAHVEGRLTLDELSDRLEECWAARTREDLARLTEDLPPDADAVPVEPARPARREAGKGVADRVGKPLGLLLLLGAAVVGLGAVVTADDGTTIFGRTVVQVPDGATDVEVGTLFGRTTVVVPDGVRIATSRVMIFGSTDCSAACATAGTATVRPLDVHARGAFGKVEIVTRSEVAAGGLQRDDDDDDD